MYLLERYISAPLFVVKERLKEALEGYTLNGDFSVVRTGIRYKDYVMAWEDCETLYAKIKEL